MYIVWVLVLALVVSISSNTGIRTSISIMSSFIYLVHVCGECVSGWVCVFVCVFVCVCVSTVRDTSVAKSEWHDTLRSLYVCVYVYGWHICMCIHKCGIYMWCMYVCMCAWCMCVSLYRLVSYACVSLQIGECMCVSLSLCVCLSTGPWHIAPRGRMARHPLLLPPGLRHTVFFFIFPSVFFFGWCDTLCCCRQGYDMWCFVFTFSSYT